MRALIMLAGLFWLAATGALGAVLPITPATVAAVLKSAQPGDVLVLDKGPYGTLTVNRPGLTLDATAADLAAIMVKAANTTILGGHYAPVAWNGAIYFIGAPGGRVLGPTIDGGGLWNGVTFRDSNDAVLERARIDRAHTAVVYLGVTGGHATDLTLTRYTVDGIDVGYSHNLDFEYVTCAGAQLFDDHHPDCAQLLGTLPGAVPTSYVRFMKFSVTGSTQGVGGYDHGTGGFGPGNVIEDSYFAISYPQAIPLNAAPGGIVRNNIVRTLPGSLYQAKINVDGTVTRCGNEVAPYAGRPGLVDPKC